MRTYKELAQEARFKRLTVEEIDSFLEDLIKVDIDQNKKYYIAYDLLALQPVTREHTKIIKSIVRIESGEVKRIVKGNATIYPDKILAKLKETSLIKSDSLFYFIGGYVKGSTIDEENSAGEAYGNAWIRGPKSIRLCVPLDQVAGISMKRGEILIIVVRDPSKIRTWWREVER